jgi:allantoin racemase
VPSIKVIIPNAGLSADTLNERAALLKTVARRETQIVVRCIAAGPISIESYYDVAEATPYILQEVTYTQREGHDAIVIYCMNDPAIEAAREISRIPVVGPGETSLGIAAMLGQRIGFLTVLDTMIGQVEEMVRRSKVRAPCLASVRSLNIPVTALREDLNKTKEAVIREGQKAIKEERADTLILGCLGLAGLGIQVQQELNVPVIDPAFVSVNMAELMIYSKLVHSRLAFLLYRLLPLTNDSLFGFIQVLS